MRRDVAWHEACYGIARRIRWHEAWHGIVWLGCGYHSMQQDETGICAAHIAQQAIAEAL